jgi:hypothetical protein
VAGKRVRLDLNSPAFQDVFLTLDPEDLKLVVAGLRKLQALEWDSLYRHPGFRWEAVRHVTTAQGTPLCSLRFSQRVRALAHRDGEFLRLVSLHPDHDSAYS